MSGADGGENSEDHLLEMSGLLDLIVGLAVSTLDDVTGASISVQCLEAAQFETANASGSMIRDIDHAQYRGGGGPCVQTIRTGHETRVAIPAPQWATFSGHADQAGVRSVWSLPLNVGDRTAAALNLYYTTRQSWDPPAAMVAARGLAQLAEVVLAGADVVSVQLANRHLHRALESRDVIGQAKGMLMARESITAEEAFDILRRASQRTNRKLRAVADDLVRARQTKEPT